MSLATDSTALLSLYNGAGREPTMKFRLRVLLIPLGLLVLGALFVELNGRPNLFANRSFLGAFLAVEVVLACLWKFEKVFFPVTMACFLIAGTELPLAGESTTLRWLFLSVGASAGLILWMRSNCEKHFGLFHLVALFCVLSALASASASTLPLTAFLKVLSLFLLFLYASTGGRVALVGHEKSFVNGLVLACEALTYLTAASIFTLGYDVFGSPNALGAIIGVAITPVLLWAALVAQNRAERKRRYIALAVCGVLLYVSVCRAAIVADAVLLIMLTLALRRPRLLLRASFVAAFFLETMAVANPSHMVELVDSLTGRFVFKTETVRTHGGLFGSREAPWEETLSAIKLHPWFGTGFGTSDMGSSLSEVQYSSIYKGQASNVEHGSSYLAIVQYMGLLGIVPFLFLLFLLLRAAGQVYLWMRLNRSLNHYSVVFAMVVFAGLVHASFEDWLFAPGSYLCFFFWVVAFLLIHLAPALKADLRVRASRSFSVFAASQGLRQPST